MSLTEKHRETLHYVARAAIEWGLKWDKPWEIDPLNYALELQEMRASFVTLKTYDNLRGCIGAIAATQPLVSDVAQHAHAAAFSDSRFPPLRQVELPSLSIHISILSIPELIHFDSEEQLIQQLRPGIDGLVLQEGWHRSTFLPSVWESLPDPRDFLHRLKQKAGLTPDYWSDTLRVHRYITE